MDCCWLNFMKQFVLPFTCILIIAFLLRLPFLLVYPPGNSSLFIMRLITSVAGIGSILLTMLIVYKKTSHLLFSTSTGLILTLMPFHIEQSRIYSPFMQVLCIMLFALLLSLLIQKNTLKILIFLGATILSLVVFNSFWFLHRPITIGTAHIVGNVARLWSIDLLFYKNNSFWTGGLRNVGVLLPWMLPFFIFGLFSMLKKIDRKGSIWLVLFFFITLISASNPRFPEQREYLLATPLFAIVVAMGITQFIEAMRKNNLCKFIFTLFICFALYGQILFMHYYVVHYAARIQNEIPKEQIAF